MKGAVSAVFPAFSAKFEGRCTFLYQDILGLLTTGIGCLVDNASTTEPAPTADFFSLPWTVDSAPASRATILAQWLAVKAAHPRLRAEAYEPYSTIRLSNVAVDALLLQRLGYAENLLRAHFKNWEQAPASCQLAALSMAWALGAAGEIAKFPKFCAAFSWNEWSACAEECWMREDGNPGLHPRNVANRALFGAVVNGFDPDLCAWSPSQ